MKTHRLGRTGLKVSEICLGTMTFGNQCDEKQSFAIMDKAAEHGVYFFDTADAYPVPPSPKTAGVSEVMIGKWLKGKRDDFVLASKCRLRVGTNPNDEGLSRRHILKGVEDSLQRLKTDYIDLYQPHMPDPDTPIDETLRALDDLVTQGKVRYLGCSNYPAWQIAFANGRCEKHGWARFESVQPRYNLLYREIETELLPMCLHQQIGVIAYNPLAGGFLTGKHRNLDKPTEGTRFTLEGQTGKLYRDRYWDEAKLSAVRELSAIFESQDKPLLQVALAWVLAQPAVTCAIVGASKPEQLDQSLPAVHMQLNDDELSACNRVWFTLPRPEKPII